MGLALSIVARAEVVMMPRQRVILLRSDRTCMLADSAEVHSKGDEDELR